MPVYIDELMALAAILTPAQLGGMLRLKAHAWHQEPPCTLPDDDAKLAQIAGLAASWQSDGPFLRDLLTAQDGRLIDATLWERYQRQAKLHVARSLAGTKGGHGKQTPSKTQANGQQPAPLASLLPSSLSTLVSSNSSTRDEILKEIEQTPSKVPSKPWREMLAENGVVPEPF